MWTVCSGYWDLWVLWVLCLWSILTNLVWVVGWPIIGKGTVSVCFSSYNSNKKSVQMKTQPKQQQCLISKDVKLTIGLWMSQTWETDNMLLSVGHTHNSPLYLFDWQGVWVGSGHLLGFCCGYNRPAPTQCRIHTSEQWRLWAVRPGRVFTLNDSSTLSCISAAVLYYRCTTSTILL